MGWTRAEGTVIDHSTIGANAACAGTRITAALIEARLCRRTLRIGGALWTTRGR